MYLFLGNGIPNIGGSEIMVLSPGQIILVFFIVAAFFSISFLIFSCECINHYFQKRSFIKRSGTKSKKLKKSSKKKQNKASYCTVAPSNVTKNYKILRTLYDSIHDWINSTEKNVPQIFFIPTRQKIHIGDN